MPKEYIRSAFQEKVHKDDPATEFRVRVGWNKEAGYVQLATVRHAEVGKGDGYQLGGEDDGFYVDLDRHSINELIRVLRKARDQSFGKDE